MNEGQEMEEQFALLLETLGNQQMNESRELSLALHIYERGQFYQSLDEKGRQHLHSYLSPKKLADMFGVTEEDNENMEDYLAEMHPSYAADMLAEMYTDNAVDLLNMLNKSRKAKYFNLLSNKEAGEIKKLLHYEDETAGAIMATELVSVAANQTVRSAMCVLRDQAGMIETIYYVYVVDQENHLAGVISLRDLVVNDGDTLITNILNERVISVHVGDDQGDIAQTIRDYDFLAVLVIDYDNHSLGIVTVDDIIDVTDDEATNGYSGLAGVDVEEVSGSLLEAASRRLPWLITLLFLGMSTALSINNYKSLINEAGILAVFISLITGAAGNTGTQPLAIVIRRLAVKGRKDSNLGRLILNEVPTRLVTGAVTGLTTMIVAGVWQHNLPLGFVIGMAVLCAIAAVNLAGNLIPMLTSKLGLDPAVTSGPFITTLSNLTNVLIYFNIASMFMRYFA